MNDLNIFDQHGNVLTEIPPAAVEALDKNDQSVLAATLFACSECENAEVKMSELRKLVNDKMAVHDLALAEDARANPPQTHVEALQAVISANDPNAPKPKLRKPNLKTRNALTQAAYELAQCRDDLVRSQSTLRNLARVRSDAILKWMATQQPITFEQIYRAHIAKGQEDRAARVARGEPADIVKVEPARAAQIDRDLAARGKTTRHAPAYLGPRNAI